MSESVVRAEDRVGPAGLELTDTGNRDRLVDDHGENLRYCHQAKSWFVWDGRRWALDEADQTVQLAIDSVRRFFHKAHSYAGTDPKKIANHALASEKADRIRASLFLAQSALPMAFDGFDADPYLLNCANGTLDLRTGQLREHDRSDFITKIAPIEFDPKAKAPQWEKFLDEIFGNEPEMVAFIQRAAGYSLLGVQNEHAILVLHGMGRNGKSVLLESFRAVLGDDYVKTAPVSMLLAQKYDGIPNDLAALRGARVVIASEPNEGQRLDEGKIKSITGGDVITARFMRGEFFSFLPTFTVWLSTNHKPVIRGNDDGIWSRLRLIPFDVRFYLPDELPAAGIDEPRMADLQLKQKLREEAPGILAWMVRGCSYWQKKGSLDAPLSVRQATKDYRDSEDQLAAFFDERCAFEKHASAPAKDLYAAYCSWAEANSERPISKTAFGKKLPYHGLDSAQLGSGSNKYRGWLGIRLVQPSDQRNAA